MINNLIIMGMILCILIGWFAIIVEYKAAHSINSDDLEDEEKLNLVNDWLKNKKLPILTTKGNNGLVHNEFYSPVYLRKSNVMEKKKDSKNKNHKMKPSAKNA